ncbi:unnamed protein product [Effrenium voratum]|nr:unnamed protein product [Effrenium voratum]
MSAGRLVVSIESGPRLSQSEPEVADALRNQQAQLEIWLEDQEKRWQEQLAEVERLFRETLDISPRGPSFFRIKLARSMLPFGLRQDTARCPETELFDTYTPDVQCSRSRRRLQLI